MQKQGDKTVQVIKKYRKQFKFTQEKLANILGVSRRQYQRFEKGDMPAWMLEELCARFDLTILIVETKALK